MALTQLEVNQMLSAAYARGGCFSSSAAQALLHLVTHDYLPVGVLDDEDGERERLERLIQNWLDRRRDARLAELRDMRKRGV